LHRDGIEIMAAHDAVASVLPGVNAPRDVASVLLILEADYDHKVEFLLVKIGLFFVDFRLMFHV